MIARSGIRTHGRTPARSARSSALWSVDFLDSVTFYGLLVIILLSLVPYGTVDATFRSLLAIGVGFIACARFARAVLDRKHLFEQPLLLLPLGGILVLAVIQLIPVGGGNPVSSDPYETRTFIINFATLVLAAEVLLATTNSGSRLKALVALV